MRGDGQYPDLPHLLPAISIRKRLPRFTYFPWMKDYSPPLRENTNSSSVEENSPKVQLKRDKAAKKGSSPIDRLRYFNFSNIS